jgi:CDP-paratose 2-epimerase
VKYLITGGAGFIGCNLAHALLNDNEQVTILDDLSRPLTPLNLKWLQDNHGDKIRFVKADISEGSKLQDVVEEQDVVCHLAGQVAVTNSVSDPRRDFEINALGTMNLLEAVRLANKPPIFLFASTNKVYGGMENVSLLETESRYCYEDLPQGCSELQPLDFHSPYGCSKGAADQYVRDYARIYGLKTVVFRQSCIYGPRQFGVEDQGWLAHFVISAVLGRQVTVYGDGKQVRDILHVDDLIRVYRSAIDHIESVSGEIFNIGGGAQNTISIWYELCPILEKLSECPMVVEMEDWRPGDQRIYISDISKASQQLSWVPEISIEEGIARLFSWVKEHRYIFTQ